MIIARVAAGESASKKWEAIGITHCKLHMNNDVEAYNRMIQRSRVNGYGNRYECVYDNNPPPKTKHSVSYSRFLRWPVSYNEFSGYVHGGRHERI